MIVRLKKVDQIIVDQIIVDQIIVDQIIVDQHGNQHSKRRSKRRSQTTTMMTLCISVLGYHAAVFSSTQAVHFKNKFLPMKKPSNNIVFLSEVYERSANIKTIENVLDQPSSFMVVGETISDHKSYFFFTEPFNGLHRLDAYIVDDIDDLSNLKTWHEKYFSNYVLQLF